MSKHLRGMSDAAPLYALLIIAGGVGLVVLAVWSLARLIF
jgi:hypothetical protein